VSPTECRRSKYALIYARVHATFAFTHPHPVTLPMRVSLGSVQLRCEAGAARRWLGSRAAYLIASVTASRRSQFASRCLQLLAGNRRAARASARGTGRAAYTAIRWTEAALRQTPRPVEASEIARVPR
jgi:hypothetical protein